MLHCACYSFSHKNLNQNSKGALLINVFQQGQRWGSAVPGDFLPLDLDLEKSTKFKMVEGVIYQCEIPDLQLRQTATIPIHVLSDKNSAESDSRGENGIKDFLHDNDLGLFYAGDFCSHRAAGVEAAFLSGIDVSTHVFNLFKN